MMRFLLAHNDATTPWEWHAHPDVWLLIAVLVAAYALALRTWGRAEAAAGREVVTRKQVALFGAGVGTLWLFSDWPIHELSEGFLLSVHMIQHAMFTLVAPPLLLLGTPPWLAQRLVPRSLVRFCRKASRPLLAGIIFNVVTVWTHWPTLVDASLRSAFVHFAVHTVMVLSALLMWMPVVSPHPEIPRISYPARMVYLFLQSVIPTVPASFLTFAEGPIYKFYATVPRLWGMSLIEDQQAAGAVMKIFAGSILWGVIIGIFFFWYSKEQTTKKGVLTWDHVEREFARTPPATPPAATTDA